MEMYAACMSPLVIGIAGGTGSGKTTIAQAIASGLPVESISLIEHDSYYRDRPDLTYEERSALNFDHPDSLETELLVEHLRALRAGEAVEVPQYDFTRHQRATTTTHTPPTPIIIVEGILVFVDAGLRDLLDIKLFVDTDADIRVFRRVRRDIEQRGRTFASIREQYYRTVRPMHLEYVAPSKRWADIIIPEGGDNRVALDLVLSRLLRVVSDSAGADALPSLPTE